MNYKTNKESKKMFLDYFLRGDKFTLPTINKAKDLVKAAGATSGIIILLDDKTGAVAGASYGTNKDICEYTGEFLDKIIGMIESGQI